jgi:4-hydroxybenzoate polyprenyltransferase
VPDPEESADVEQPAISNAFRGITRLKLFWALSRTPHGLLDMCTPCAAALLRLGSLPPVEVVLVGLVTTFAGYTAVYAWNDVVDFRVDREKAAAGGWAPGESSGDLDGVIARHPMAQGLLSFREGLLWAGAWSLVAAAGAFRLNPACVLIFAAGCLLEAGYCLLWRVSPYRALVSGAVKTSGAMAAVVAVDPAPSPAFLAALFLSLFLWEVGGQNIPNDVADLEEDRRLHARTIPVRFGLERSIVLAVAALALTLPCTAALFLLSPLRHSPLLALAVLAAAGWLLLVPGLRLVRDRDRAAALALFNRASWFPPALLAGVLAHNLLRAA